VKLVIQTAQVAVYDDVLAEDDLVALRRYVAGEKYTTPLISGGWVKAWRPADGQPFCTELYLAAAEPLGNALDLIAGPARETASIHPELIGSYTEIAFRSFLYPRGTKISWHDDRYAGAVTFYVHPRWGATWGGELMVADAPPVREFLREASMPREQEWLTPEWEDDYLSRKGIGLWIAPKPNRLVLTSSSAYHLVNRVDGDAGEHVRAAVVGFYRNRRL
jgi:hypothetical protein